MSYLRSLVLAVGLAALAGGVPRSADAQTHECGRFRGVQISRHSGTHSVTRIHDGAHCLEIHVDGAVEFTDDDADVARLSPGGWFAVDETRGATRRRLEIDERGGRLDRSYWLDGERRPADEAAEWLRAIIPVVARESVAGAERRAARVLRARGARGVFDEVALIASDTVKTVYLAALLDADRPNTDVLRDVARVAGERVASDSKRGGVLRHVVARAGGDVSALESVAAAAARMASDSERARTLVAVAAATEDARVHVAVADVAHRMSSDTKRGEVLAAVAGGVGASAALRDAYFRAARAMASDSERRRALLAAFDAGAEGGRGRAADGATLAAALETARHMASDSERGQVLRAAVAQGAVAHPAARDALFRAADAMSSDNERGRVLVAVAGLGAVDPATVSAALRSAGRLHSDGTKATVLLELATRTPALRDSATREAFFETLRTVRSSGEYRRVMDAVVR